ncbi:hypothetical protein F5Y18DRAFT_294961 [Xylariaceae sp. FL1019]|nr:hypothetical protein F5Y18DRAFT_294961 [Xylariaceae sp. FL1019]
MALFHFLVGYICGSDILAVGMHFLFSLFNKDRTSGAAQSSHAMTLTRHLSASLSANNNTWVGNLPTYATVAVWIARQLRVKGMTTFVAFSTLTGAIRLFLSKGDSQ